MHQLLKFLLLSLSLHLKIRLHPLNLLIFRSPLLPCLLMTLPLQLLDLGLPILQPFLHSLKPLIEIMTQVLFHLPLDLYFKLTLPPLLLQLV